MKSLALVLGCSWALVTFDHGRKTELTKDVPMFPASHIASVQDLTLSHSWEVEETQEQMLERYADKYAVPDSVWRLVYRYETSSGANVRPRHEPHVERWLLKNRNSEFQRAVRKFATNKERLKLLASSHGPLQVMGYHAISYGIDPEQLANDRETQIELGMVRLANAWHATRKYKSTYERGKRTGKAYNGGDKYAARLARDLQKEMRS